MRAEERVLTLRNGQEARLFSPGAGDAQGMLAHLAAVSAETHFLKRSPADPLPTLEEERRILDGFAQAPDRLLLCVAQGGRIVAGAMVAPVAAREKVRHRAEAGLSVRREYWGQGIGGRLMRECVHCARAMGYLQLELSVFSDNLRAIALYERMGFTPYGRIPGAFRLSDGTTRDSLLMGMALSNNEERT